MPVQRFIILKTARTGSSVLSHALDRHPRIRCVREALSSIKPKKDKPACLRELHRLYSETTSEDSSFGITLNPLKHDLDADDLRQVLPNEIAVIELRRLDLFAQTVSRLFTSKSADAANRSDGWGVKQASNPAVANLLSAGIHFNPEQFSIEYLATRRRRHRVTNICEQTATSGYLVLTQEGLLAEPEQTMNRLLAFIGVPITDQVVYPTPSTKVINRPLEDCIENYTELKQQVADLEKRIARPMTQTPSSETLPTVATPLKKSAT